MKNKQQFVVNLLVAGLVVIGSGISTQAADSAPAFSGKIWTQYASTVTKGTSINPIGFSVGRGHLTGKYSFDENWMTSMIIDANSSGVSVYNAWAGTKNYKFGLQPTYFIDNMNKALKTRWIAKSLVDEFGINPSQSGGLGLNYNLGEMIELGAMIHNKSEKLTGTTAITGDINANITAMNSDAMKLGVQVGTALSRDTNIMTALWFNHNFIDAAAEFAMAKPKGGSQGMGYGATANIKATDVVGVYGRYFMANSNLSTVTARKAVMTAGLTCAVVKGKVDTGIFYEATTPAKGSASGQALVKLAANF